MTSPARYAAPMLDRHDLSPRFFARRAALAFALGAVVTLPLHAQTAAEHTPASAPAADPTPAASPAPAFDMVAILEPIRAKADVPALWACITTADGLTRVACTGVREAGKPTLAQPGDLVHLGSCGKSMTATVIALLVREGKLRWDLTLAEAFPDLADEMDPAYRPVTLAQLCTHRGGVPADLIGSGIWAQLWLHPGAPRAARRLLAERLLRLPPACPPGTQMLYANAGFALAGHIAETVLDTPYEDLIRGSLLKPLEIRSAGFGAPGRAGALDQPRGHTAEGKPVQPGRQADNPPAVAPAGTIHMSLEDWAKYIRLHLRGASGADQRVGPRTLTAEDFARLHTPPDDVSPYAFGWVASEQEWAGPPGVRRVIWHNGSNTMWYVEATLALEKGFAVMVATNRGGPAAEGAVREAMQAVIRAQNQ